MDLPPRDADPDGQGASRDPDAAFVITEGPVPIDVREVHDERTPDDMVCLGTTIGDRLIARCVVPPEALVFFREQAVFDEPVRLALGATEEEPGLQCRLFAVVQLPSAVFEDPDANDEESSPWTDSVPSSRFDQVADQDAPDRERTVAVLLGHIVRFDRDRRHPGDLPREAADVLASIVSGRVSDVVDKVLEDLLSGEADPGI